MTIAKTRASIETPAFLAPAAPASTSPATHPPTHVFVVGAGYVGLVTAVGLAQLGHRVTVHDINSRRIEGLQAGRLPIFEPGLDDALQEVHERVSFTSDPVPPADARYSFVAVGTPLGPDGQMQLRSVEHVVRDLLQVTDRDHTIAVRSTMPPTGPAALQALRGSRTDGPSVVTNPEFLREGSALRDFERPGRLMAGWLTEGDRPAAEAMLDLYAGIDAPTFVADAKSVAFVKLASNVFLHMKVSYANELARICDAYGADMALVADGIGLDDRIGRSFLDPGPGVGGSCLPEQAVALRAITRAAGIAAPLVGSVADANDVHRTAIVARLATLLGADLGANPGALRGRRIAIFGLAFKANTDDVRQSPALAIAAELRAAGASVVGTDPRAMVQAARADGHLELADGPAEAAAGADAVIVVTEWHEYRTLDWRAVAEAMRGALVYDTRGIVDLVAAQAAGLHVERLGRPGRGQAGGLETSAGSDGAGVADAR